MSSQPENTGDPAILNWRTFLEMATLADEEYLETLVPSIGLEQTCFIVYTSGKHLSIPKNPLPLGTKGTPKGVVLNHRSIAWTATKLATELQYDPYDTEVLFLPLHNIMEIITKICIPVISGSAIYFSTPEKVAHDMFKVCCRHIFGL